MRGGGDVEVVWNEREKLSKQQRGIRGGGELYPENCYGKQHEQFNYFFII